MQEVFAMARRQAPVCPSVFQVSFPEANESHFAAQCILVLEDLDSLITDQNRSFFLVRDAFSTV